MVEFGLRKIKESFPDEESFRKFVREALIKHQPREEWNPKSVTDYIMQCRSASGIPMFRTGYGGEDFEVDSKKAVMAVCLTPTTSIMVDNFIYMPISKLYEKYASRHNLSIMGFDFSKNMFIKTPILDAQKSKPSKILEIKLENSKIKCSLDHPFFRKNQNHVELVNAFNLKTGDLLPLLANQEHDKRFLIGGLFAGDGWIHHKQLEEKDGGIKSVSESLLTEISNFLEEIGIKTSVFSSKLDKAHFGKKPVYTLYIPKRFLDKLKEWSKLPYDFEFLNSWLSGFYDAEGHITIFNGEKKHFATIGLTNSNINLLLKIQEILKEKYHIKSTIIKDKRKENLWQLLIRRNLDIVKFSELIGFSHPEKRRKLKTFLEEVLPKSLKSLDARIYNILNEPKTLKEIEGIIKAHKTNIRRVLTNLTRRGEISRIDKSFYTRNIKIPIVKWMPIREIKEKSGQYTFDFTTGIGNFIANNIIVHNCWGGTDPASKLFINIPREIHTKLKLRSGDWHFLMAEYRPDLYAESKKYPVKIR